MDSAKKNQNKAEKSNRKRKQSLDFKPNSLKKKKPIDATFTEVNFKVLLKDINTSFTALGKFLVEARRYPADTDYDLVAQYCKTSTECAEMFQLLEGGKRKPGEVCAIFESLEQILMRTADDLVGQRHVAQNITRRLLANHLGLVYVTLGVKNKAAHIKAALKLLTAMVMQGENSARDVHLQFKLDHPSLKLLLNRRDKKDPQDVRTCVIHFLLAFLIAGDGATVRQIVEHKDVLSSVFPGLQYDSVTTVQLVLSTLLDKVVQNPGLNKTCRVGVFTERSLSELSKLYQWKGPANWHIKWKKKGKVAKPEQDTEVAPTEMSPEDLAAARNSVHHLMLELSTSLVHGITFLDKTYGTMGKNQNHLVTRLLTSLTTPHLDLLEAELVVKATAVCPDLLHWYMPSLRHAMEPRDSESWGKCVQMITQVYEAQPSVLAVFRSEETLSTAKYLSVAMAQLVPPKDIWKTIMTAIQSTPAIQIQGLGLLLLVLNRIHITVSHCLETSRVGNEHGQQLNEFVDLFREALKKLLPDSNGWMVLWTKCVDRLTEKGVDRASQTSELPVPSPADSARALLSVICAYQTAIPPHLQTHALSYGALLEGVQEVTASSTVHTTTGTAGDMWADMFKILCESGEKNLQWTKLTKRGKSFVFLLLETVTTVKGKQELQAQVIQHVVQMLQTTGIFPGLNQELTIWLTKLSLVDKSDTKAVLEFMEQALLKLFKDPYTYTERVMEVISEAATHSSGGATSTTASVASTSEALVDMILSMDEEIILDKGVHLSAETLTHTTQLSFSPLVPMVLESLAASEGTSLDEYIGAVLHTLLRTQTDPAPLATILNKFKDRLQGQRVMIIAAYFLPGVQGSVPPPIQKKLKKQRQSLDSSPTSVSDLLEVIFEKSHSESVTEIQENYSAKLMNLLEKLPRSEYQSVCTQCVQYFCWGEKTDLPLQLFVDVVTSLLDKLWLNQSASPLNNMTSTPDTSHNLLEYIMSEILTQSPIKAIIRHVAVVPGDLAKTSPKKKNRGSLPMAASEWDVKTVHFLGCIFEKIPQEFCGCLENVVKTYTEELETILENSSAVVLSKTALLMNLFGCFWRFMEDSYVVKIAQAVIRSLNLQLKHDEEEKDVSRDILLLSQLLRKMNENKVELFGHKLDKSAIVNLSRLILSKDIADAVCPPVLTTFTRYPPYCEYITQEIFEAAIDIVVFGAQLPEPSVKGEKLKGFVRKLMNKKKRRGVEERSLLGLAKLWMRHSHCGNAMFEDWVQGRKAGLDVQGLNLGPLLECYFRVNRKPDKTVSSILLSHHLTYLDSSVLTPGEDISPEVNGGQWALETVLPHAQMESVLSLRQKLSVLIQQGQVTLSSQIHVYKELVDFEVSQLGTDNGSNPDTVASILTTTVSDLLKGLADKLAKKGEEQDLVCKAYMDTILDCFTRLKSSDLVSSSVKETIFGGDVKQLNMFIRHGLKSYYGECFFKVMQEILEIVLGVRNCQEGEEQTDEALDETMDTSEMIAGSEENERDTDGESESSSIVNMESESDNGLERESETSSSEVEESEADDGQEKESETDSQDGEVGAEGQEKETETDDDDVESETPETDDEDEEMESESSGVEESSELSAQEESMKTDKEIVTSGQPAVCPLSGEWDDLVKDVYAMLLTHSQFLDTVLAQTETNNNKACLLDLLLCLVRACGSVCDTRHLAIFFGGYGASLTPSDQKLVHLIELYEKNGCSLTQYRPYLFGEKAVEHYSVLQNMGPSLSKEVKMSQVLECLDPARLWKSVLNMPLRRIAQSGPCVVSGVEGLNSTPDCYDPHFLLPSFCHLLAPENVVSCHAFVEHHCLSYSLAALSCHSDRLRALAYTVLSRFYQQLQLSRLQEKQQLLSCLECVRNSVLERNSKLACIITVFLAKAVVILLNPDHAMYSPINAFLLLKPSMDVLNVPEFYKLFNSSTMEYKTDRSWVVGLLHEGLRETSDYRIFEKRYTFKLLLTFHDSALSDQYMKKQVLQVLRKACAVKTSAFDLTKNHGLLTWLAALIRNCETERLQAVISLIRCLWFTLLDKRDSVIDMNRKNPVLPVNLTNEIIALLLSSLTCIKSFGSRDAFSTFVEILESCLKHRELAHQYMSTHSPGYTQTGDVIIHVTHLMALLQHWCHLHCPSELGLTSLLQITSSTIFSRENSSQNEFKTSVVPLIPVECFENETEGKEDGLKCDLNLLYLIQKVKLEENPNMELVKISQGCEVKGGKIQLGKDSKLKPNGLDMMSDSRYIWLLVIHLSLQFVVAACDLSSCRVLHKHFEWMKDLVGLKEELVVMLKQKQPLTTCIGEMLRLAYHKMKEAHGSLVGRECNLAPDTEECQHFCESLSVQDALPNEHSINT